MKYCRCKKPFWISAGNAVCCCICGKEPRAGFSKVFPKKKLKASQGEPKKDVKE
jgi:hypothetical protein